MKKHIHRPESLMMSYGYHPEWSEGAVKCPIFMNSTFVFAKAEEGKAFFEVAYGLRPPREHEKLGLIYSRINNPDLEILENRLTLWDGAEECAVFESGMSAITTVLLEFLKPGDLLLVSSPLYGGTDHFIQHFLPKIGVETVEFSPGDTRETIIRRIESTGKKDRLAMIYIETPANPTNTMIDIALLREVADLISPDIKIAVDNTYMGPLWQHPLSCGADFSIYSATKYIGGHSDVIAGAVCGNRHVIKRVKTLRTFLGNMTSPHTCWLLMRSLETLKVRMKQQAKNATRIAHFLEDHPAVAKVYYPGLLRPDDGMPYAVYHKQCTSPGAMVSFDIKGGEKAAFSFLNQLRLIKLAVSLGGTESLAEHPDTMTHAGVEPEHKRRMGITGSLIRLSVGIEYYKDLIYDIRKALEAVEMPTESSRI